MLQRQHLFSVYLHPLPDFGSFPEESIFHGREIPERIQVCTKPWKLLVRTGFMVGWVLLDTQRVC